MIYYILYRMGYAIASLLPRKPCYRLACVLADLHYHFAGLDREAVLKNLRVVMGGAPDDVILSKAKVVFRNFAKYLVDFFRFSKLSDEFIRKNVKTAGLENIDEALSRGKGAIVLSAHLGNWELGGAAVCWLGYPMAAVAMRHQIKGIDDFFARQRAFAKIDVIPIGAGLKRCFSVLKGNGLVALLGDRDFSANSITVEFFGRPVPMPRGPAALSRRLGAPLIPIFMIRERDDSFRLEIERPIYPEPEEELSRGDEAGAIKALMLRYLKVIEDYVRRYPEQWYMFRGVWNGGKDLRPNTII